MGQSESSENNEVDAQQILDSLTVIKRFQDSRFGDSSLVEHKETKQQCVLREFNSTDQSEHEKSLAKYRQRLELQHPNSVKLLKCFDKTESQFCSTFYKTYLLFEFVQNSIEKEIINRREKQEFFSEGEIWNTMGGAIQGLAFLQRNGIPHSTIRTGTIYLSDDSQPKVTDPTIFQQLNNFATVCQDKDNVPESIYLSPILMNALEEGNWQPTHNEFKSDVFSFGMTLLSMGLLDYLNECYHYSENQFLSQCLENRLLQFSQRYSQDLTQFIMLMLKTEEEHRLDFIQLEEILISQPVLQNQPQQQQQQQQQQQYSQPEEQVKHSAHTQQSPNQQQQSQSQYLQQSQQVPEQSQRTQEMSPPQQQQFMQLAQQPQNEVLLSQQKQTQQTHVTEVNTSPPPQSQQQFQQQQQQFPQPAQQVVRQPPMAMQRDEPDQGSTNNFVPKDQSASINKPDENQGNEIGRGTYREEEEVQQVQNQQQQQQQEQSQQQQVFQTNYQVPVVEQHKSSATYHQSNIQPITTTTTTTTQIYQQQSQQQPVQEQQYSQSYTQPQQYVSNNYLQNQKDSPKRPSEQDTNIQTILQRYQQQPEEKQSSQSQSQSQQPSYSNTTYQPAGQSYQISQTPYQQQQQQQENKDGLSNQFQQMNINKEPENSNNANTDTYNQAAGKYYQNQYQPATYSNSHLNSNTYTANYNNNNNNNPSSNSNLNSYQNPSQSQQQQSTQSPEYVIENYQNGSRYEGEKLNNMRHGKGKFYYQDNGGQYDGQWSVNKMHGKGVLYYASGKKAYDGDWVEDKFEGFGILFNENPAQLNTTFDYKDFDLVEEFWTKYDGEFKDDNKEGYGTLYLSNGEKFSGTFNKDFVNGSGTFYAQNGQIIKGNWDNNKLISNF